MTSTLDDLAQRWLELDRNPSTRQEIQSLVDANDLPELESRLRKQIAFGTAGLRARMSAGFSRMNDLTIIQASQGLASYVLSQVADARNRGIVIGHDARYQSASFARLTAAVFIDKGYRIHWLDLCHTPLVPFTIGETSASVGVMVTASHNPKDDNGYKVYWGNGCQIIPPHDRGIAVEIEQNLVPTDLSWDQKAIEKNGDHVSRTKTAMSQLYVKRVIDAVGATLDPEAVVGLTYTPMHGVGLEVFQDVTTKLGILDGIHVVTSQAEPDPEFPTVRFPNPEEKGALDEAIRTARTHGDRIILANDPDADRFAVAELVDEKWIQLTGNQIGVLLASFVLERSNQTQSDPKPVALLASAVSSRMLAAMAAHDKAFHFEETLTGFKWLGNRALELQAKGYDVPFAYEEAIGFMLSSVVHDKDGIAAAALFIAAAAAWNKQGLTPWGKLQSLYTTYGYFEEANTYLKSPSPEVTERVFQYVRHTRPEKVGGRRIVRWRDLTVGIDTGEQDGVPALPVDKSAQMITCELEDGVVFTVRGSGTEPKIKLYIEGRASTREAARAAATDVLRALLDEWFKPAQNGLVLAESP